MDLNKKVTVLTPNGRRQNIKITPSTTLLQILEEASEKHGFPSDEYGLKSHNKELDLMQMFRFTGLPNNCLLEMFECTKKRVESTADICVQLENGNRCQGQFSPSTCLWDILSKVCPEYIGSDMSPVVIYMRKEIFGEELKQTTLKSLGVTGGRTMMRLVNKNPDEIKTQAGVYVPPEVKEEPKTDEVKPVRKQPSKGGFSITSELVQSLKKQETMEDVVPEPKEESTDMPESTESKPEPPKVVYDWGTGAGRSMMSTETSEADNDTNQNEMEIEPEVNVIGERNAVIYSLDSTQKQMEDLPDSFFDLTVNDLKLVLRDLKKITEGNDDAPLLTAKMREIEENSSLLRKLAQYKQCIIRVQFPDRNVLQGVFKPTDKVEDVVSFVRPFLTNEDLDFHLFTVPPKKLLPHDKTLLEVNCIPNAVLHFGVNECDALPSLLSYLKKNYLMQLTSPEGAFYIASKSRLIRGAEDSESNNSTKNVSNSPGPSTGAIPKRPRNDNVRKSASPNRNSSDVPKWFKPSN
ncbi:tether containing UBX domain for GLUT4 [Episyrphus balteatus]|uniref:tether containing UBX domain for GLUT4 n=1 Tax=Episyrphus balteatus TaxID=286459 RepID=UPI002484DD81|nr:tether containing UBX domain for GLUT4 [Episyrphus balteatus]